MLELDVGNTRVKWRLCSADGVPAERGACTLEALLEGTGEVPVVGVQRVRAACVRGAAVEEALKSWAAAAGARIDFARVQPLRAGVSAAYADTARLGVDRWLCLLAAYNARPGAACVIQCGSAITVDLVDALGQHRGGLIAPGLGLMQQSLLAGTDRVRFAADTLARLDLAPGRDTDACVRAGISTAAVGLIERALRHYLDICPDARALITGGDAARIAPLLEAPVLACPELVLDGLRHALD